MPPADAIWIASPDADGIATVVVPANLKSPTGVCWEVELIDAGGQSILTYATESDAEGLVAYVTATHVNTSGANNVRLWTVDAGGTRVATGPVSALVFARLPPKPKPRRPLRVGTLTYGALDEFNRATGVTGTIRGPKRRGADVPGSVAGQYTSVCGHLFPQAAGGVPDPRNLVPLTAGANTEQSGVDSTISQWLDRHPGVPVQVQITPRYTGENPRPTSVTFIYTNADTGVVILQYTMDPC